MNYTFEIAAPPVWVSADPRPLGPNVTPAGGTSDPPFHEIAHLLSGHPIRRRPWPRLPRLDDREPRDAASEPGTP